MNDPLVVSLTEAAELLGIGQSTAYRLASVGEFPVPVLKVGAARKVSKARLEAFVNGVATGTAEATR